jgi:phosphotransferase system HPr-like phosphotransfer protein
LKSIDVILNSINKIKEINKILLECESDVDLISGRYVVDAKSLPQIILLDLENKVKIEFHSDNDFEKIEDKLKEILSKL